MNLPTTSVILNWRRFLPKSGRYPVHIRITIDRIQKYHPVELPLKISKAEWLGQDDNWVSNLNPFFFEINTKSREQKQIIQNIIKRYYMAGKTLSISTIFSELNEPDIH